MGRRRRFSLSRLMYYLTVGFLCIGIIFLTYRLMMNEPVDIVSIIDSIKEYELPMQEKDNETKDNEPDRKDDQTGTFKDLLSRITPDNIQDPKKLFIYQMPFIKGFDTEISRGDSHDREMPDIDMTEDAAEVDAQLDETLEDIEEEEEIPDDIKIVIEKIEDDLGPIELTDEGPQILIYHSHSREAYKQDPDRRYEEAAREAFRSNDLNSTVVRVGDVLAHHLKKYDIPVLHDRTEHEQGNYNNSYGKSLETLKKRMKEYDSLKIFIDLHRNAYKKGTRSPDQEVVEVDGERVAKMSVVIGTGKGQVGGFKERPKWQENYKLALKLTNKINEICPGLAKPVMVQSGRYNQHVSTNAILIEVGSNLTTLSEAERTTKYIAQALNEIIK